MSGQATFAGVNIDIDTASVPTSFAASVTEQHIPGGPISYVDIGGQSYPQLTLTVKYLNLADYVADLEPLVGTRANLVCFDGTLDARLLSVSRAPFGVSGGGQLVSGSLTPGGAVAVTCQFLVYAVLELPAAGATGVPDLATFTPTGGASYPLFVLDPITKTQSLTYTARHLPGTNADYVDDEGPTLPHISTDIAFPDSLHELQFRAACCGLQGTLVLREGTYSAIPLSVNRSDHTAQALGPCTVGVDWLMCTSNAVVRTPSISVRYSTNNALIPAQGEDISWTPLADVYAATVDYGYDMRVAEATVTVPAVPSGMPYRAPIQILLGAGASTLRFTGYVAEFDATHAPQSTDLVCRGLLWQAQVTANQSQEPIDLTDGGVGQTDVQIVNNLLTNYAQLPGATLAGITPGVTPHYQQAAAPLIGTVNQPSIVWEPYQTVLDCIDQLETVGMGYRTFDTPGGTIVRQWVSVTEPSGDSVMTLTEGIDILDASSNYASMLDQYGFSAVSTTKTKGVLNDGTWFGHVAASESALTYNVEELASEWIEKMLHSDAGDGLSCEEVANWRLGEISVQLSKLTITTPRDDAGVVVPGCAITVDAPTRLGINQLCWVQHVEPAVSDAGVFTLQIICWTATSSTGGSGVPQ